MTTPSRAPEVTLRTKLSGLWELAAIGVVCQLDLADRVSERAKSVNELAQETGTQEDGLYRVLRLTATFGLFEEVAERVFAATPTSRLLESGAPGAFRDYVLMATGPELIKVASELRQSVTSGEPVFPKLFGMPRFDYMGQRPELTAAYTRAMAGRAAKICSDVASAYDFPKFDSFVDVGGSHGILTTTILHQLGSANPRLRGTIFDRPEVIEAVRPAITASDLAARIELVGGDFFQSVPEGADAYILLSILVDWADEQASLILHNCRRAMAGTGSLLIVEGVMPPGNEPFYGKVLDVHMLASHGGKVRSRDQFEQLLGAAGFQIKDVVPTGGMESIIEALPG